ncbi:conjugal transfer protein TrbE [Klebsiella pneumoniae]|nr:conjugal transfer protein TrbE [Klebsiella pneumoniae]RRF26910.1 conjugal transfer protein TrbE [Klebsiella pneumoniae]
MKINFHKQHAIDFVLRLTLTIIIISPVIYFSWDAVKATSGSDYVESVVLLLRLVFLVRELSLFSSLAALLRKKTEEE